MSIITTKDRFQIQELGREVNWWNPYIVTDTHDGTEIT